MEYTVIKKAYDIIKGARNRSDSCLVAFSGGKDSLCCLDMCVKQFKRVVPFCLFFVPGLEVVERQVKAAKELYGLDVLWYPHFILFRCIKQEIYNLGGQNTRSMFEPSLHDIYRCIMFDTKIPLVINGSKEADSLWRRQKFFKMHKTDNVIYPLQSWRNVDVLAYLKINGIPIPEGNTKHQSTGVDLTVNSVLWLHDKHPNDYKRMSRVFPFIGAIVARREMYGE